MVPLGLQRHKQLRVLVCDGPALLAWVGAFHSTASTHANARCSVSLLTSFSSLRKARRVGCLDKLSATAIPRRRVVELAWDWRTDQE